MPSVFSGGIILQGGIFTVIKSNYTLGLLKECIYKELDEFSSNGNEISLSSGLKADIEKRMLTTINSSLQRVQNILPKLSGKILVALAKNKQLFYTKEISQSSFEHVFNDNHSRLAFHFYFTQNVVLRAYDELDNELFTQNFENASCVFCEGKALIDSHLPVRRIVLSATGDAACLNIKDFIIYSLSFVIPESKSLIAPYNKITALLPDNIGFIDSVSLDDIQIPKDEFEFDNNIFTCPEKYAGVAEIAFSPKIKMFDENSSDSEPILLPDITCCAVIALCAAELCPSGYGEKYSRLMSKFQNIASNVGNDNPERKNRNSFFKTSSKLKRRF